MNKRDAARFARGPLHRPQGQVLPQKNLFVYLRLSAREAVSVLFSVLLIACQAEQSPITLPLNTIDGGIADVQFNAHMILLDQRAAPYLNIKLADHVEIFSHDQKPISLLDLRAGDFVRVEGHAAGNDSFLATRLTLVRSAPRTLPTATPNLTPPSATPLRSFDDRMPLPGTLLIADPGNNRIMEVNADKRIVWEFSFAPEPLAPNAASFTPGGKTILASSARFHQVVEVDYATRQVVWSFGEFGVAGSDDKHLNTPADAHRLPDGRTLVAEMRNCRIAIIAPDQRIAGQIGKTGDCRPERGYLARPNGVTLLPNGRLLVTEIGNRRVSEVDGQGKTIRATTLPGIAYPSGAQLTRAGNILVAAYDKPGRIVEVGWNGQIVWEYFPKGEGERLDRPSLALELPNGNIVLADDHNHRVGIIDRAGIILWQYGVTGVAGKAPGFLNTPSGIDFRAMPMTVPTATRVSGGE